MWLPQTYLSLNLTIPIHAVIFAKIYSRPWQEMPTNCHIDLLRGGILFPKENGSFQEDGNSFNANVSDFSLSRGGGGNWVLFNCRRSSHLVVDNIFRRPQPRVRCRVCSRNAHSPDSRFWISRGWWGTVLRILRINVRLVSSFINTPRPVCLGLHVITRNGRWY